MQKVKIYVVVVFIYISLFSACSSTKDDPIKMDSSFVNEQIIVRAPSYANSFGTNESLILELKYNSENEITFPNNYGLRIFEESKDGWIEIEEKPTERTPSGEIIFSPYKYLPAVQVVGVYPYLRSPDKKHNLRVYVIGKMMLNGNPIEVAAYTDVTLKP